MRAFGYAVALGFGGLLCGNVTHVLAIWVLKQAKAHQVPPYAWAVPILVAHGAVFVFGLRRGLSLFQAGKWSLLAILFALERVFRVLPWADLGGRLWAVPELLPEFLPEEFCPLAICVLPFISLANFILVRHVFSFLGDSRVYARQGPLQILGWYVVVAVAGLGLGWATATILGECRREDVLIFLAVLWIKFFETSFFLGLTRAPRVVNIQ